MQPENRVASDFRWQAQDSRALGSALYGVLLDRCADDIEAGGPTAELLKEHLGYRRRDVLPLRLLAGVHAVVLTGRAPELAAFYPSAGGQLAGDEEFVIDREGDGFALGAVAERGIEGIDSHK